MEDNIEHISFWNVKEISVIVWPENPIGFGANNPKIETVKLNK